MGAQERLVFAVCQTILISKDEIQVTGGQMISGVFNKSYAEK